MDNVNDSLVYYIALKNAGVPVEMHLYPHGEHAFGLRRTESPITGWPRLVETWLKTIGMIVEPRSCLWRNSTVFSKRCQSIEGQPVRVMSGENYSLRNGRSLVTPGSEPALNNCAYIVGVVVKHNFRFRDHFMSCVDDLLHEATHRRSAYYSTSDQDAIARLRS